MKDLWLTTAGELLDFMESETAAGREPKTPEEWSDFMQRMAKAKEIEHLGHISDDMSGSRLAGFLRDDGVPIKLLKTNKKSPEGKKDV